MGFATVSRRIRQRVDVPIDGLGPNQAVTPAWQLPFAGDETPRDIALDSGIIFGNTTMVSSPEAYWDHAFSDISVLGRGIRGSIDLRVKADPGATESNITSQFNLIQPSAGSGPSLSTLPLRVNMIVDPDTFELHWGTASATVAVTIPQNTFRRVGFEIIPEEDIVRAYLSPTTATGESANADLTVRLQLALSANNLITSDVYVGVGFSNTSAVAPSGGAPNYSGANNLLIEEFEGPTFTGNFPGGAGFELAGEDPYIYYKNTLGTYQLLTRARIF